MYAVFYKNRKLSQWRFNLEDAEADLRRLACCFKNLRIRKRGKKAE